MPILTIDSFATEGGAELRDVPVAYTTRGRLNAEGTNAVVVCHALTGSHELDEWWGPLVGPGRPLDTDRFYVICLNVPGSPYGSVSPLTMDPATGQPYGASFPEFTIRDTVRLHRRLLDQLGVQRVTLAIGASMGGMHVLEWAYEGSFVERICPIAVGGRHSAWCIGWGAAQRQAITADPKWNGGRYAPDDPPAAGLAAARMMAMISYRSQPSFQRRFGRETMTDATGGDGADRSQLAVESYLRYQGEKLVGRFDANCYVHLTRQMDSHDVSRGRGEYPAVLGAIEQPTLVIGVDSDVLYPLDEQRELAEHIPDARLEVIRSDDGHDAFLIAFDQLADILNDWLSTRIAGSASGRTPRRSSSAA